MKEKITRAASFIPSGDNCQPFHLRWKENELEVTFDEKLARHKLNERNYASMLSLGTLLENVRVAALSEGLRPVYELNEANPLETFVIKFENALSSDDGLLAAIEERCTDRRPFQKGDSKILDPLLHDFQSNYKAKFRIVDSLPPRVFQHMVKSDNILWNDDAIFFDTFSWVRFTDVEAKRTLDGMPATNLGLNIFTKVFFWITGRSSATYNFFGKLMLRREGERIFERQAKGSTGFIFFYPEEHTLIGVVETGKLVQRIWLELTKINYGAQPTTLSTLLPYIAKKHSADAHTPPNKVIIERGIKIMEEELNLPIWGLRFGQVKERLPNSARTYRRTHTL